MTGIRLVVGLGNPGREYAATRHNAGFMWVERLAGTAGAALKPEARFHGLAGRLVLNGRELWLLQPQTFMNVSGRAVAAFAHFYRLAPEEILVVHDELDLPPGTVRLKQGGGHGGHNGLKDIVAHLRTPAFWRLRFGIGHPGEKDRVADYVLHPPSRDEAALIDEVIGQSLAVLPQLLAGEFQAAMLKLHTKPRANNSQ